VLEINERPRRDLRLLIDAIGQRAVLRHLNVHRTTVGRWLSGATHIPGAQALAVRALLGDLPGTCGAWTGWRFHDGELIAPGGDRYTPGDVLGIRLQQQRVSALDHELRALRLKVKTLEKTIDLYGPAANESRTA
jgi:Phage protein